MGQFTEARDWWMYSNSFCLACAHNGHCLVRQMHERWGDTDDAEQRWALDSAIPCAENGHTQNKRCRMFAPEEQCTPLPA